LSKQAEPAGNPAQAQTRAGFAALIGAPNAGKSTLVNTLVGAKVTIVTHKAQTTRAIVRGVVMHDDAQIVLVDTPGIFRPKRRLDEAMVATAWTGAKDCDLICVLIDAARGIEEDVAAILEAMRDYRQPKALILNKVDAVRRESLLELAGKANAAASFDATFMVSAKTGSGCRELLDWLAARMPPGPFLYPEDEISDLPQRQLAAEITREKLFLRLHEELPYASHVETERWTEQDDGSVRIDQVIFVERDSQKKIVIGKGGQAIKAISTAARKELSELLERPVHLFLFVKVRENWGSDPERYRNIGLEFPRG
jgi:GTP-binding protein Era